MRQRLRQIRYESSLVVIGTVLLCNLTRVWRLVIARERHAERKGGKAARYTMPRQHGDDETRIQAAAEKSPHWHVTSKMKTQCSQHFRFERIGQLIFGALHLWRVP